MQRIIFLLLIFIISSCASNKDYSSISSVDWEQHFNQLEGLNHWKLKGKLGYRDSKKGGSVWIHWKQQGKNFDIKLSGPLGVGATKISRNQHHSQLHRGENQLHSATTAEELTKTLFGWQWPVEQLLFWVKGIPDPATLITASKHNKDGTLSSLEQSGWILQFFDYQQTEGWTLPRNIKGAKGAYQFNLKIKKWHPN
ncbi:MAG: outer membrane lipoprotein LolB [Saprospiraceae bacterium]|jgi:outer membrane lipoprotein LolB|tara:strand:+ start:3823 stop:4413 length:591 start_codon:yes stop_codon:yes gene_type:complete